MSCDPLAYTGPGIHVGLLLVLAAVLLVVGAVILLVTRRRGRVVSGVLLLLVGAAAVSITAGTPVPARADACPPADNFLTIVQTSVMDDLAPGISPVAIEGFVRNNGTDSTYLEAVAVRIVSVRTVPHAVPGGCDATDYLLLDPLMPVGRTLGPGDVATFRGASIGLRNKDVNQDTCKSAVVVLRYTANPT